MKRLIMAIIALGLFGSAYAGSEDPTDGDVILSSDTRTGSQPEMGSSSGGITNIFANSVSSDLYDDDEDSN